MVNRALQGKCPVDAFAIRRSLNIVGERVPDFRPLPY
jgi:hypothetical protein